LPDDPLPLPGPAVLQTRLARARLRLGRPDDAARALDAAEAEADGPRSRPELAWLRSRGALQRGDAAAAAPPVQRSPPGPDPPPHLAEARCAACPRSAPLATRRTMHTRTFHRSGGGTLAALPLPTPGTPDPADPKAASHTFRREGGVLRLETRVDGRT